MLLFWTISVDYSVNAGNENKNRSSNGLARLRVSVAQRYILEARNWKVWGSILFGLRTLSLSLARDQKKIILFEKNLSANAIYKLIPSILFFSPLQVVIIFLKKMDILLAKTPKDDVRDHVLPMVCKALETPAEQLQVQYAPEARENAIGWVAIAIGFSFAYDWLIK